MQLGGRRRRRPHAQRVQQRSGGQEDTPLAKRPATFSASDVSPGSPQEAQGNAELTNMVVAMETRMRAIEASDCRPQIDRCASTALESRSPLCFAFYRQFRSRDHEESVESPIASQFVHVAIVKVHLVHFLSSQSAL